MKKITMHQLEKNLIEELNDNKKQILDSQYPEDLINEYVDGWIPIYNSDLIEALSEDHSLAYVDDTGILGENPDVHQIIRCSIYEKLSNIGNNWLYENQKEVA
jgi:hypothetical protein